jgi:hypothetical protein
MSLEPSVAQTVRRVAGEHDHLRGLLAQVEAAFGRPEPRAGSGPDVVAARLDALRGPLRAQFEEEERAGLLEAIEECVPTHAADRARLRGEHLTLIRQLDSLRSASPIERRGPIWLREVRRFLGEVEGHERREAELLRGTFEGSIPPEE